MMIRSLHLHKVQASDGARYSEKAWNMIFMMGSRGLVLRADTFCCYRVISVVGRQDGSTKTTRDREGFFNGPSSIDL